MRRCYDVGMRTTLDIEEAVLAAAKAMARDSNTSVGAALSALARRGLTATTGVAQENGFPVFVAARAAAPITLDLVNAHRDD